MIRAQASTADPAARGRDNVRTLRLTAPQLRGDAGLEPAPGSTLGGSRPETPPPHPIALRTDRVDGVLVLSPTEPQLDHEGALDRLRDHFDRLFEQREPPRRVVLNLSAQLSLSGRAIGLVLGQYRRLNHLGGSMRLAGPSASVATVLEIVGLASVIESYSTLDEAIRARWPDC